MSQPTGPTANPLLHAFQKLLTDASVSWQTAPSGATTEGFRALQSEWLAQHTKLWQGMLQKQPDQPAPTIVSPPPGDRRFAHPAWSASPMYDYLRQAYWLNADYLQRLAEQVPDEQTKRRARFLTRQLIDAMAPSNFAATNPEFIDAALASNGESIRLGLQNLIQDLEKGRISMTDEAAFEIGRNLAATPGAVVFENELMQLIQYAPLTAKVARRPLLMVPPCINKFYVLDLQPENSLVRYAIEQGHTVFMLSWRNVDARLSHFTWDDYLEQGVLTAIRATQAICGVKQINALGFCVGGTLLASALAVARGRGENPVASLTLLTTLLDFSEGGELGYFIDEASVALREAAIGQGGLMRGQELATVFSALRANDLIWPYVVGNYLKGGKPPAFDLLYWNADSTNLPGPFVTWYLRHMYLENALCVPGKLTMCGVDADLGRVDMPAFLLACREDHIVPWRTSFLGSRLLGGDTRFVLGASGHIAGVINPAAKNKRSYWSADYAVDNADDWLTTATETPGSWWPLWADWLKSHGGRQVAARRRLGSADFSIIEPAPGRYVREKA